MNALTLGEFRKLTSNLPDSTVLYYHSYDHGCCLNSYVKSDIWFYPKDKEIKTAIVINPGDDYDSRGSRNGEE